MDIASIYIDGAAKGNPGPAGIGVVIKFKGNTIKFSKYIGHATNNRAEYIAAIEALKRALAHGVRRVRIFSDSLLLVNQLTGKYRVKNPTLRQLFAKAMSLLSRFEEYEIIHVPREMNKEADFLANEAIKKKSHEQAK